MLAGALIAAAIISTMGAKAQFVPPAALPSDADIRQMLVDRIDVRHQTRPTARKSSGTTAERAGTAPSLVLIRRRASGS